MLLEEIPDEKGQFYDNLCEIYSHVSTKDNLSRLRAAAWDRLHTIGLPDKKSSLFRPLNLRPLFLRHLKANPELTDHRIELPSKREKIVFINGRFSPQHSQIENLKKRAVFLPLEEAWSSYSSILTSLSNQGLEDEDNPFTLINSSCQTDGLFLYIPPHTVLDEPLEIHQIITESIEPSLLMPKLTVVLGRLAEVKMEMTTKYLKPSTSVTAAKFEFLLEEGASLSFTEFSEGSPKEAIAFNSLRATLKRDSVLTGLSLTQGSKLHHLDWRVFLLGENGSANLSGLWILRDSNEAHTHVVMDHQAPNCRSMQLFKGVLHDRSHSSFDGKILIARQAQKVEAYQLNNNLVLSPDAKAETKPNLKIFADDVKASHGATVGQLDEEQLFYLLTRGFSKATAEDLLTKAFCQEVINLIPNELMKSRVISWE